MTSPGKHAPLYRRIRRDVIELLRAGKWRHGQAIPSEPLLAQRFGASIGTVRKAIDALVAENLLVREQGRGTFVKSHTRDYMLNVFFRFVDAQGAKELPRIELLAFTRTRAGAACARALALAPGAPVLRVRNRLWLDGRPTLADDVWLSAARFPGLTARELAERDVTIYGLLQQKYGVTVVNLVEHLEAVAASAAVARELQVAPGAPLLRIDRRAFAPGGEPIEWRVRYVRTGKRRYESVLGQR